LSNKKVQNFRAGKYTKGAKRGFESWLEVECGGIKRERWGKEVKERVF
jgi:hypothetical protein